MEETTFVNMGSSKTFPKRATAATAEAKTCFCELFQPQRSHLTLSCWSMATWPGASTHDHKLSLVYRQWIHCYGNVLCIHACGLLQVWCLQMPTCKCLQCKHLQCKRAAMNELQQTITGEYNLDKPHQTKLTTGEQWWLTKWMNTTNNMFLNFLLTWFRCVTVQLQKNVIPTVTTSKIQVLPHNYSTHDLNDFRRTTKFSIMRLMPNLKPYFTLNRTKGSQTFPYEQTILQLKVSYICIYILFLFLSNENVCYRIAV